MLRRGKGNCGAKTGIMDLRRLWVFVVLLAATGMLVTACGSAARPPDAASPPADKTASLPAVPLAAGEKLRVVATTNIVGDVVAKVGGDRIELTTLVPAGTDPHTYEPTPQDLRAVVHAHVIFANGVGLEAFLDKMIANAGSHAPVIPVSQGVELLKLDEVGDGESHGEESDPHTWFDPNNVVIWVRNIERTLKALDPANADAYAGNARAYVAELEALDQWIREQVARVPAEKRKLVTDHLVLGYFARAYGFEMTGAVVEAYSAAAEPSAQELITLEESIRRLGVPAVFVGRTVNPKLAARVAEDTGVRLVPLYTGSLSEAGGEADSYVRFMRYNVTAIVSALQ
ncbi:MAG: zinc ABC transporter substrate-binding protein [Chloroflexi bacterium]|nr:MAG: zinc ABC transporter substrate-binding protein [Chloroflexota bacterium]